MAARDNDPPLGAETLELLGRTSTATLTLQLLKRGLRNIFIKGARPLQPDPARFAAEAFTLRFIPMREDLSRPEILADPEYPPRKAIEVIPAGAALVIEARGETGAGVIGDILATRLAVRGIKAVVSDGPVRDAAAVAATGLAVFCNGRAAPASLNLHFGAEMQGPIGCGGVAVFPGDVMVGDGDGVIVLPRALADEIALEGFEQEQLESFLKAKVAAGSPAIGTYPPDPETRAKYEAWRNKKEES